jgi:hypothetical protein
MGGEPAHLTNPQPGDQDFLSGLFPLAFGVPTPLLQGNKICNPRQGPLQGYQPEPAEPWFFWGCYSSPSSFLNWAWDQLWRSFFLNSVLKIRDPHMPIKMSSSLHSAPWGQLRSYLEEKVVAPVQKTEINDRGNPLSWPRDTLYPQKLALLRQQAAVTRSVLFTCRPKPPSLVLVLLGTVKVCCEWHCCKGTEWVCNQWKRVQMIPRL